MPARPAKDSADTNRIRLVLGAVFGVVAVALILAIVLSGGDAATDPEAASEYSDVTITGQALPQVPSSVVGDASADPAFGMPIPEISGQNFAGEDVAIIRDGRPKAILFVAHGCPHCQDEIPAVQQWLDESGGVPGVDIIAVSTSASEISGNWPPSAWLAREGWSSPVIADDEELSAFFSYGGTVIPYWVFADADGNVTRRIAGGLGTDLLELAMMETLAQ